MRSYYIEIIFMIIIIPSIAAICFVQCEKKNTYHHWGSYSPDVMDNIAIKCGISHNQTRQESMRKISECLTYKDNVIEAMNESLGW